MQESSCVRPIINKQRTQIACVDYLALTMQLSLGQRRILRTDGEDRELRLFSVEQSYGYNSCRSQR